MTSSEIQLDLLIVDKDADAERLDELTVRLMRELRELGAESVDRAPGEPPPEGAKGDPFTIGALVLAVAPAVLPPLVSYLQAWSLRGRRVGHRRSGDLPLGVPRRLQSAQPFQRHRFSVLCGVQVYSLRFWVLGSGDACRGLIFFN